MPRALSWLFGKASRDTASGQFIAEIDGLRFIAISSVLLYHIAVYVNEKLNPSGQEDLLIRILSKGSIGVQLFFVISGFVIALPFAKAHFLGHSRPSLSRYFFRRLTRLEPPYVVNLIVLYLMQIIFYGGDARQLFPHFVSSMLYLHTAIYGVASTINYVAWSLEVELQFYLLAPILTFVFGIRSDFVRRSALGLAILILTVFVPEAKVAGSWFHISILPAAKYFLSGFLLLDFYLKYPPVRSEKSCSWDVVSGLAWICFLYLLFKGPSFLLAVPVPVAYYAGFKGRLSNRFLTHPLIYTIGGMCYTIYLYHYAIVSGFGRFMNRFFADSHTALWINTSLYTLLLLPVILLVSTIAFVFLEKPCMKKTWFSDLYDRSVFWAGRLKGRFPNEV